MGTAEHSRESFQATDFGGRDLTDAVFEDCTFVGCNFREADLTRARFLDCTFNVCDLSNARLANARVWGASFTECKLMGIQWVQLESFSSPRFFESNLSYCNFSGLKLKRTDFFKCVLRDADFSQADLSECDFQDSDLLHARFQSTSLLKADLRGARGYLIDPVANKVRGAKLSMPEAQGLLAGLGLVISE